jgi:hypothetical protein
MYLVKIANLMNTGLFKSTVADYKGLDINQFLPGSQAYHPEDGTCVIATDEDLSSFAHDDVTILTEAEYVTERAVITDAINAAKAAAQDPITTAQSDIDTLMLAVAELYEGGTV